MVTLEQISVALEHPFVLLLIGAGVSGGLVTWLSHWLEDRRKKREIEVENAKKDLEMRVDIASKMTELFSYQYANAYTALARKKKTFHDAAELSAYYEDYKKWYTNTNIVTSKLNSYFPDTDIGKKWDDYCATLFSFSEATRQYFYEALTEDQKNNQAHHLKQIRNYFSDNGQLNLDGLKTTTLDEGLWGA